MARAVNIESDKTLPKKRKTRKPMSAEQKKAAGERLAIAREKRLAANPPEYKSIHPDVLARGDEDAWSHINVKKWIKTQKELASAERKAHKSGVKGAYARMLNHEGYVKHMKTYLRTGDWVDLFYGEHQEKKIRNRCIAQAYYWYGPKKGQPKFNVGTYYPMLGTVYTQEMYNDDNGVENADVQKTKTRKRKRNKRTVEGKVKKRRSTA